MSICHGSNIYIASTKSNEIYFIEINRTWTMFTQGRNIMSMRESLQKKSSQKHCEKEA